MTHNLQSRQTQAWRNEMINPNQLRFTAQSDFDGTLRGEAPATCGEFAQGFLGDRPFLVNCPIDRFSVATVKRAERPGLRVRNPQQYSKIQQALALLENDLEQVANLEVSVHSDIPRGKGMASSTADLCAALAAVSGALNQPLDDAATSALIAKIEPSDSVHLTGVSEINHLNGAPVLSLPAPLNMSVMVVDCGGAIDTLDMDRKRAKAIYQQEQGSVFSFISMMRYGLRRGDLRAVAQAATASAALSQKILPKPIFNELLQTALEAGALGLNCAHSGTVLGVLYYTSDRLASRLQPLIESRFGSAGRVLADHRVISGGCHVS